MSVNEIVTRKFGEMVMGLTQLEALVETKDEEIKKLSEKLRLAEMAAKQGESGAAPDLDNPA